MLVIQEHRASVGLGPSRLTTQVPDFVRKRGACGLENSGRDGSSGSHHGLFHYCDWMFALDEQRALRDLGCFVVLVRSGIVVSTAPFGGGRAHGRVRFCGDP